MTPTTYGRDFAYCLKSHGGVRGFNASLWRFLLRCTLFCHSVATFLTSVSSYEGGCGFEEQFIDSIEKNILTQRNISEYYKLLNISSGKLEKIVRSTIEQSPREYIQKRLVTYVCLIAEYTDKKQMPIKKIAELVHYKNQCTLSELVKKHIGISLLQYLNLEPEKQHRIIHRTKADQNAVLKVLPKTCIREDLIPDLF